MNFSNPTHTIPLNGLPSTRSSHRNSSYHHPKPNTQFEQILLKTKNADDNEHDKCLPPLNGKSSEEDVNVNRDDILEN